MNPSLASRLSIQFIAFQSLDLHLVARQSSRTPGSSLVIRREHQVPRSLVLANTHSRRTRKSAQTRPTEHPRKHDIGICVRVNGYTKTVSEDMRLCSFLGGVPGCTSGRTDGWTWTRGRTDGPTDGRGGRIQVDSMVGADDEDALPSPAAHVQHALSTDADQVFRCTRLGTPPPTLRYWDPLSPRFRTSQSPGGPTPFLI